MPSSHIKEGQGGHDAMHLAPLVDADPTIDRELSAAGLLDVGLARKHHFTKNGHILPAEQAFQSSELISNLMKLGLFSMNIPLSDDASLDGDGLVHTARIPVFLLAMGLDYAIEASPTIAEPTQSGEPVISLDALAEHIAKIENGFGAISIDHELVDRIAMLANYRLMSRNPDMEA